MERRLVFAIVVVLIVAFFAVRSVSTSSAPIAGNGTIPESPAGAASDAAAATRAMTFTEPKAASK